MTTKFSFTYAFIAILLGFFTSLGFVSALSQASSGIENVVAQSQTPESEDPALSQNLDGAAIAPWWHRDIHSESNWTETSQITRPVIVAVIDTGVDIHHPDLSENIWVNPGEDGIDRFGNDKRANGIDDDQNGFIDDVHGWNFTDGGNHDLTDHHGHGTHIAGIIASTGKTHPSLVGIAPHARLMILKYFDPKSKNPNPLEATIKAIRYAVLMGADIINYSGGGTSPSKEEKEALEFAAQHGVLVIAAAGNEHANSDLHPYFPADYELSNILSVTAIDEAHDILSSSNFGRNTVGIAAPGAGIVSTLPGGKIGAMTGTSQATAFVTGISALLLATRPDLNDPQRMIQHILSTGNRLSKYAGKSVSESVIDVSRHLSMRESDLTANGLRLDEQSLEVDDLARSF